jgi:hypothetical protein
MRLLLVLLAGLVAVASPVRSDTLHVPGQYATIQAALGAVTDGDVVQLACGTYLESNLTLTTDVVIHGNPEDPACVVIDAGGANRMFTVQANVLLQGITMTNGVAPDSRGGAVRLISGDSELRDCRLLDCRGDVGGAVAIDVGAVATFTACEFNENGSITGGGRGGAVHGSSAETMTFVDCDFSSNSAGFRGGAILIARTLPTLPLRATLQGCTFRSNSASGAGAIGLYEGGAVLELSDCRFLDNDALNGGAIVADGQASQVVIDGCEFTGNTATSEGAGLFARNNVTLRIEGSRFEANECEAGAGAALRFGLDAVIVDTEFAGNRAAHGGGLLAIEVIGLRLERCRFLDNEATVEGGGAHLGTWIGVTTPILLDRCRWEENVSDGDGAGLWIDTSRVHLRDSVFRANRSAGLGGGFHVEGVAYNSTVEGCTFHANQAVGGGSAMFVDGTNSLVVRRSILSGGIGARAFVCDPGEDDIEVSCTNLWGNAGGDWDGCLAAFLGHDGNFSADPRYCDPGDGNLSLQSDSPCGPDLSPTGCGLVGALDVGCGTVSLEPLGWGRLKSLYR